MSSNHGPLSKLKKKSNARLAVVGSPVTLGTDSKVTEETLKITEQDTIISAQAAVEALLSLKQKTETGASPEVLALAPKVSQFEPELNQMEENNENSLVAIEVWKNEDELQLLEIQPEDEHMRILEIETDDEDDVPKEEEAKIEMNGSKHGLMGMFGDHAWLCVCGTQFQSERSLKSHVHLKSGSKPFKCQFCDEAFPRRDYLTYHLKNTHAFVGGGAVSVKLFTCPDCGAQLKSRKNLRSHKAKMQ